MDREILFKAKRKNWKELSRDRWWIEGYLLRFKGRAFICELSELKAAVYDIFKETFELDGFIEVEANTICQYTGLTDKNGNKIWENDIVELPVDHEPYKVEWDDRDAKFVLGAEDDQCSFDNYDGYELTVAGNIFDNPELLVF